MGEEIPTYGDPRTVDPMWLITLAEDNDREVDDLLEEYNLKLPSHD